MVRLILHLLKIRDYESCKSCETLREQLTFVNAEKKELMETLLQLTKPQVVIPQEPPKLLDQIQQAKGTFARRRGLLEQAERNRTDILKTSQFIAKPDSDDKKAPIGAVTQKSIEELESRLGLTDDKENVS